MGGEGKRYMNGKALGGCHCGRVKFEFTLPVKSVILCHCNMCRRLSGADYTTWVSVSADGFRIDSGHDKLSEYRVSERVSQNFCTVCGTRVTTMDVSYPGVIGLLGVIESDVDATPSANYFVSHKAGWSEIGHGLPCFGGENGFEPMG